MKFLIENSYISKFTIQFLVLNIRPYSTKGKIANKLNKDQKGKKPFGKKSGNKSPVTSKIGSSSNSKKNLGLSNQLRPLFKDHILDMPSLNTKTIESYDVNQLLLMFNLIDSLSNHITTISKKDVDKLKNILFLRSFNNGIPSIVSFMKSCRKCILLIISGESANRLKGEKGLPAINSLGFPRAISFLAHILQTETGIRELLRLLKTFKVLIKKIDNKKLNYASIIEPHQDFAIDGINHLEQSGKLDFVQLFLGLEKFTMEDIKVDSFPIISKNGPNGQAILNCHEEIFIENNLNNCINFFGEAPKESLIALKDIYHTDYNNKSDKQKRKLCDSRIVTFPDKGLKARTVAIVTYWTQLSMDGLMKTLNDKVLSRDNLIDCTFNQVRGVNLIKGAIGEGNRIFSIDLQTATDRIPALLSKAVLASVSRNYIADQWYRISCKRSFAAIGLEHKINYVVGTPIGIKSGFSVIALTLHYLVQLSYLEVTLFKQDA